MSVTAALAAFVADHDAARVRPRAPVLGAALTAGG